MIASEPWLERHIFNGSEMALLSECQDSYARKVLDTADIVREAIYRQLAIETTEVNAILAQDYCIEHIF